MSDITQEIFRRLNKIDNQLAYLIGQIDAEKPHLLTESQMRRAFTEHVKDDHVTGSSLSNKAIIAVATGCGAASAFLLKALDLLVS